ncbi:MAG: hypothetical protein V3W04_14095 [Gammaproteobacteria bacterium]
MEKLLVKILIVSLALAIPHLVAAQQKLDIVQIMGQFVQANALDSVAVIYQEINATACLSKLKQYPW